MIKNITPVIHKWILSLISNNLSLDIIDCDFNVEDGMNRSEYIKYETEQFSQLSQIYDLNTQFDIQLLHTHELSDNKTLVFFYIINHLNKIVCKMSITIKAGLISSNNYLSQLVPKYTVNYNQPEHIQEIALAIKSPFDIKNIISKDFSLISLSKADNFEQDNFFYARFELNEPITFNKTYNFYINYENQTKEKRTIFFDKLDTNLCPFVIENNTLISLDNNYPVHISVWHKKHNNNFEYPRGLNIPIKHQTKITATDCLDNDWTLIIE